MKTGPQNFCRRLNGTSAPVDNRLVTRKNWGVKIVEGIAHWCAFKRDRRFHYWIFTTARQKPLRQQAKNSWFPKPDRPCAKHGR